MFYDILIEQAPTDKEKNIIKSIRNDERKHNQILRELYYNLQDRFYHKIHYQIMKKIILIINQI